MVSNKLVLAALLWGVIGFIGLQGNVAQAADAKIGVMNVQKVLVKCAAGVKAKAKFDEKIKEVEAKFKEEQDALVALQTEIDKKGSAWNKETADKKAQEFDTKRREFQAKTEAARQEMKQLQDKELEPILKAMEKVVIEYGKKNNYSAIFDSKSGIIYFNEANDISDELIKALDESMK